MLRGIGSLSGCSFCTLDYFKLFWKIFWFFFRQKNRNKYNSWIRFACFWSIMNMVCWINEYFLIFVSCQSFIPISFIDLISVLSCIEYGVLKYRIYCYISLDVVSLIQTPSIWIETCNWWATLFTHWGTYSGASLFNVTFWTWLQFLPRSCAMPWSLSIMRAHLGPTQTSPNNGVVWYRGAERGPSIAVLCFREAWA